MKLYMHPISTACRPVFLFAADNKIAMDHELVDLMTGAHMQQPYASINPNSLVPMLEDGDFRLTESSAILKYLADKIGSPAYPKDLKQRAKVNEIMDWITANSIASGVTISVTRSCFRISSAAATRRRRRRLKSARRTPSAG